MARWEPLGRDCRVLVTEEDGFTTDTLLLAQFSLPRPGEACADFGTGCGVIPLLWVSRGKPGSVLGIELRREAADLAARSVEENGFSQAVSVVCGDIRRYRETLPHEGFHLIACNPPYYPPDSGDTGKGARETAWHGGTMFLQDLISAARFSLRFGGRLCVCLPVERLAEAMEAFRRGGLEPKRLRLVQSGPEKPPYLFLLECRKGGKSGLQAEPVLLLTGRDGAFTPEMLEIYGDYRKNSFEGTPNGQLPERKEMFF